MFALINIMASMIILLAMEVQTEAMHMKIAYYNINCLNQEYLTKNQ